ncbi:MAG: hypothetical protein A3B25_02885 [Candidatus Ryanbacteria bacterium RIFCSPLOWO2_01_FULL_48_26]|uniref:Uncharacterized protein n=1 Tax=Candidatus Ryanbacteria bacterium RIFCSPLOWO2_01_FULL_48_26 TaxID=1802126 RepID=A0A1G2GX31_9BACT|nr:MAG: hypothetical protein A3B25_02885 [Candidatus Ryanbacteria bacterium RIFCSPLOWO2_01_FULL_48_26]
MPFLPKPKAWHWTAHARFKMKFYGLSEARVRRIVNSPKRIEEGIAPKTVAMMQVAGSAKHPYELWTMIVDEKSRRKVISAWRYPGVTKPKSEIAINFLKQEYNEFNSKKEYT